MLCVAVQVLTDGSLAELVPGGADRMVDYEDRLRYAELVKDARMNDGKLQVTWPPPS